MRPDWKIKKVPIRVYQYWKAPLLGIAGSDWIMNHNLIFFLVYIGLFENGVYFYVRDEDHFC